MPRCSALSSSQSDSRVVPVGSRPDLDTSRSAVSPSISSWVSTTSLTSRPTILAPSIAAHGRTWTSRADDPILSAMSRTICFVAEDVGADGFQLHVFFRLCRADGQVGQVLHEHWLDPVFARADYRMDGEPPQQPGDVVEENVLPPEDDRRLEDCMGQPRRSERPLDERLAAEVRQRGIERGVRYADVHDAAYAGRPRGAKERVRVAGRHVVGEAALGEPYPVRVEQRVDALQAPGQSPGVVEAVGLGLHPVPEGTGALRPARQRPHGGAAVQQPAGDVPARVPGLPL